MINPSMVVMIRWGVLDPDYVWKELASFSNGTLRYVLLQSNAVMNPEFRQYLIEMRVEGIPVRRAKMGVLLASLRGLSFEFPQMAVDPFVEYFNAMKPNYIHGIVDDWFTISMSIGSWYYMNDLQVIAADAWEADQHRLLMKDQQHFSIDLHGIDKLLRKDENDIDQPLDDLWNDWTEPDDDVRD